MRCTEKHGGHFTRAGKKIVDRSEEVEYKGHTYLNKPKRFDLDGHKMLHHLDRVREWQKGERIAPVFIDMGLTKFCNINCCYCIGVTQGMEKGTMIQEDALMRMVNDAWKLGVKAIAFIGDGEPTLNPALYDVIDLAADRGVETAMATNGILINMDYKHMVLKKLIYLRITIGAANRLSYGKIHQTSMKNFDRLVMKIRDLVRARNLHSYKCTIGFQMVLVPENFDQVIPLAELGLDLGIDYLQVKQCSDTEFKELGVDWKEYEKVQETLRSAEKLSTDSYQVQVKWKKLNILEKDGELYREGFRKYDVCYGTPFMGQISGNGKVYPCGPFFGKDRFLMGDIHETSYYDIVKSDRYWAVHRDIEENVDVHSQCTVGCRQDYLNKFLWDVKNPPEHVNFI